jgi:hypothetical protein
MGDGSSVDPTVPSLPKQAITIAAQAYGRRQRRIASMVHCVYRVTIGKLAKDRRCSNEYAIWSNGYSSRAFSRRRVRIGREIV